MRKIWGATVLAAAALTVAACGSSGGSTAASGGGTSSANAAAAAGGTVSSTSISGTTVLTDSAGRTLYWFVPDTSTTSKCTGSCATYWPPVKGPVTAGSGVTGTLGTITRPDGSVQASYDGHPLYTYAADTGAGQAKGNGVNESGGVWHEMTVSGSVVAPAAGASSSAGSGSGGGYGY